LAGTGQESSIWRQHHRLSIRNFKVLDQKFGHCWDFSDVFVTLCRASDIPARQVTGWLHGLSGHVWAEVLVDGNAWKPVDPTSGIRCGSDYIPFMSSADGEISLLYLSEVEIEIVSSKLR